MVYLYDKHGNRYGYYSVMEFAHRYNLTERTVWNWIKSGMPTWAVGQSTVLIPAAQAREWVAYAASQGMIRL